MQTFVIHSDYTYSSTSSSILFASGSVLAQRFAAMPLSFRWEWYAVRYGPLRDCWHCGERCFIKNDICGNPKCFKYEDPRPRRRGWAHRGQWKDSCDGGGEADHGAQSSHQVYHGGAQRDATPTVGLSDVGTQHDASANSRPFNADVGTQRDKSANSRPFKEDVGTQRDKSANSRPFKEDVGTQRDSESGPAYVDVHVDSRVKHSQWSAATKAYVPDARNHEFRL